MKKFYFSLLAMSVALVSQAAEPSTEPSTEPDPEPSVTLVQKNVYAYDIVVTPDVDNKNLATVEYKLNGKTASVSVQALVDGLPVGDAVEGTTDYENTVEVEIPADAKGMVTFEITAVPEATVTEPTLVQNSPVFYQFWSPTTVAINNNPNTATFGRALTVENRWHNTPFTNASYHACGRGAAVYAFDPLMVPVLAEDDMPGFTFGLGANNDSKTQVYGDYEDLVYTKDGRLFLASADLAKYGIYEINPDDMNAEVKPLFEEATNHNVWAFDMYLNEDGTYKVIAIESLDANAGQGNGVTAGRVMIYDYDGEGYLTDGVRVLDSYSFPNGIGMKVRIDPDGQGFYVSSHRGGTSETEPHLIHADMNGENIDNDYTTVINAGAMGYNKDNTLFARAENNATVSIYKVTALNAGEKPSMEKLTSFNAGIGNPVMAVAFDYANNIYVSGNSAEKFQQFQLPAEIAGESTVVPSPESMAYEVGKSSVDSIAVGNNAAPVYYNLLGVRMQGKLNAGVYVKVVDGKATKVVVK